MTQTFVWQAFCIVVGSMIYAQWKDSYFYPGKIAEKLGDKLYKVSFEDGDIRIVQESDLILEALVVEGHTVMAERDGWNQIADIVSMYDDDSGHGYEVKFDDHFLKR